MTERRTDSGAVDEADEPDAPGTEEPEEESANARDELRPTTPGGSTSEFEDPDSDDEAARSKPGVPEPLSTPVRSGSIDAENAAFVVLGALATVALFVRLAGVAV
ncbi:hypothetical protein C479_03006 [Halovivax asiaticus JCM 14624]|uniref:DUF7312 domain-containing protein n=1 Tax=Halovivax asiaticus JCM 14624 TaxID=1227490 RepID=M0BS58_9EURY|nr:hypothetical protein [Halovivax asiaticus]ELZ13780.1 hypothetical protein C479_03006 [Halovivax asiaticus JCM 14624]